MLTKKQSQLLEFLKNCISRDGLVPSYEEMKNGLGLKSKSGIHGMITSLEERGFLRRLPGRARALEILSFPLAPSVSSMGLMVREDGLPSSNDRSRIALSNNGIVNIPFYGAVSGDRCVSTFMQPQGKIAVPSSLIQGFHANNVNNYWSLQIEGHNYTHLNLQDQDLLIFELSNVFKPNVLSLFLVNNLEMCLKKTDQEKDYIMPKGYLVGLIRNSAPTF